MEQITIRLRHMKPPFRRLCVYTLLRNELISTYCVQCIEKNGEDYSVEARWLHAEFISRLCAQCMRDLRVISEYVNIRLRTFVLYRSGKWNAMGLVVTAA